MVDIFLPNDVIFTVGGSVITAQITDFKESGGTRRTNFDKTIHRHYKKNTSVPQDWKVSLTGTVVGTDILGLYAATSPMTITIVWTGSQTITYVNAEPGTFNYSMKSNDRLGFKSGFNIPFYSFNGSENRSVS